MIYLSVARLPGSSRLVTAIDHAPQTAVGAHDRYYSLDNYPFDFRFYIGHKPDMYVVSDWDDSALSTKDNWQKELWDANNFGAPGSTSHLLLPADFLRSVCSPVDYRRWLLADAKQMDNYPQLKDQTPYFEEGRRRVYLVPAGQVMPSCAAPADSSAQ